MRFEQFLVSHEIAIRLGAFVSIFVIVGIWESTAPRRALSVSKALRWGGNLGVVTLNGVLMHVLFPLGAVGVAAFCTAAGWGVLNHFPVSAWLAVPMAIIAMDFVIWLQHVLVHAVPALWRLHRVHHADLDYDLTTGSRFHPLEIGLSMLIKVATICVLGPPVVAVVLFELILSSTAMFNHGNIKLPVNIDKVLRWFIVTPDMHRVHHSVEDDETNCNFGFNLTWWDRLLGTYRAQPRAGQLGMTIGIDGHTDLREVARLDGMLLMPFRGKTDADHYAINRRSWLRS